MVRYQGIYLIGETIVKEVRKKCKIRCDGQTVKVSDSHQLNDYLRAMISVYRQEVILYLKRPQKRSWTAFNTFLKRFSMAERFKKTITIRHKLSWIQDYKDQGIGSGWSDYRDTYLQASAGWHKSKES